VSTASLLQDVDRVYREVGHVVMVVTETMRDKAGEPLADPVLSAERDAFGHPLLRGTADAICRLIHGELGLRSRFDKPGSLQRMSMITASSVDLCEAREVGRAAVRLALSGETQRMVTLVREGDEPYRWHTGNAPLLEIANRQRLVPDDYLTPDGRDTTDAFRRYALPLLGPEPLPHYATLEALAVTL
jgi:6-phosphofructokinase 1